MSLRFEHAFIVKSPADRVWAYLTDPYRVAPALPGAAITEKADDGSYGGTITIKVGPVSARYKGSLRFEKMDAAARSAEMVAKGQDVSGRGGADMRMQSHLTEKAPGETEVSVVSEVNVTGVMAQFGRGLIQDVSNQMFQKFSDAVKAELEKEGPANTPSPPPPATHTTATATTSMTTATATPTTSPPIEVISFGTKILARAAGRIVRRPGFWVAVAAVGAAIWWLVR